MYAICFDRLAKCAGLHCPQLRRPNASRFFLLRSKRKKSALSLKKLFPPSKPPSSFFHVSQRFFFSRILLFAASAVSTAAILYFRHFARRGRTGPSASASLRSAPPTYWTAFASNFGWAPRGDDEEKMEEQIGGAGGGGGGGGGGDALRMFLVFMVREAALLYIICMRHACL